MDVAVKNLNTTLSTSQSVLLNKIDQCVMCGLCLPHCPTYSLTKNESESPRGRLLLASGWLRGSLQPSTRLRRHLDNCLLCGACEAMCPSKVPFTNIMDTVRNEMFDRSIEPGLIRKIKQTVLHKRVRRAANQLRLAQRTGLLWLARKSGLAKIIGVENAMTYMPVIPANQKFLEHYPARRQQEGRVALFTGCITEVTDQQLLRSTITLLTTLGYEIVIPKSQACCGALHAHSGDRHHANQLAHANIRTFLDLQPDVILSLASGCQSQLNEYNALDDAQASLFSERVMDINQFLNTVSWPGDITIRPLSAKVAVHEPCSMRGSRSVYHLLSKIPDLTIVPLPENNMCCGGAGLYPLVHPRMAQQLGDKKFEHLETMSPDVVVSANTGCALQLQAVLKRHGKTIPVIHPVSLLANQI